MFILYNQIKATEKGLTLLIKNEVELKTFDMLWKTAPKKEMPQSCRDAKAVYCAEGSDFWVGCRLEETNGAGHPVAPTFQCGTWSRFDRRRNSNLNGTEPVKLENFYGLYPWSLGHVFCQAVRKPEPQLSILGLTTNMEHS